MFLTLRKTMLLPLLVLMAAFTQLASAAGTTESFTKERFDALQAQGAPVLIDVHAVWCPTCKRQGKILSQFQQNHSQCNLTILKVDFDDQKEWVTHFKAPRQSTLVLYNEGKRVWFSVAETRASAINDALTSNIKEC